MNQHTWLTLMATFLICTKVMALPDADMASRNYTPKVRVVQCKLGETMVPIKIYAYGNAKDIVMVNVHSNESTSVKAGMAWLRKNGGLLIKIENGTERNILFKIGRDTFQFDPNHIFSRKGIIGDFKFYRKSSLQAISETEKFAKKILSFFPPHPSCIVALHNNFPDGFGIDDYMPKGEREADAANVYKSATKDPDDIFFTTDSKLFEQLSNEGYNTILQNVNTAEDDGSLSMHYHKKNIRYLNCETEHEKTALYEKMITDALVYVERFNDGEDLYAYHCTDTALTGLLQKGVPVYKDSLYVGEIKSTYASKKYKSIRGKITFKKGFVVEKNMTFTAQILPDGTFGFLAKTKKGTRVFPDQGTIELKYNIGEILITETIAKNELQPAMDSIYKR